MADAVTPWPWSFLRIAHRGIPARAQENSLRGFVLAMILGADMVETDLRLSADGELVLAHDDLVTRPGERSVRIARTPLDVLRRVAPGGQPLATLAEALVLRHHGAPIAFNLDIKVAGVAGALVRALRAARRREGILLTGDAAATFADVRAQEPWVCAALTQEVHWRIAPVRTAAHAIPELGGTLLGRRLIRAARAAGVSALTIEDPLATPATIAACHRAGLRVVAWTVDVPARLLALRAAGIDGITTNRVDVLVALDRRAGAEP